MGAMQQAKLLPTLPLPGVLKLKVKLMLAMYIIFFVYFLIQYFFTQTIYSKNKFVLLFIFSFAILGFTFFSGLPCFKENKKLAVAFATIPLFYSLILFTIKKIYLLLNNLFIVKKWISQNNTGKDFTYFLWSQSFYWPQDKFTSFHWWDEKLAKKPTILDRLLTGFVLFFPFILSISLLLLIAK